MILYLEIMISQKLTQIGLKQNKSFFLRKNSNEISCVTQMFNATILICGQITQNFLKNL